MDRCGVEIMEEDRTVRIAAGSPLTGPLDTSTAAKSSSTVLGNHNMELSAGRSGGVATGLDEYQPLLSVTQRIKEKREGEC